MIGDIFCIFNKTLYLLKFAPKKHVWVPIQISTSPDLARVTFLTCGIYISRTDSFYYLDADNFLKSKEIKLCRNRPKKSKEGALKEGKSCNSVKIDIFNIKSSLNMQTSGGFRLAYVM